MVHIICGINTNFPWFQTLDGGKVDVNQMIEILRPRMAAQTTTKDELRDAFQVQTMYSEYAHMVMVFNITIFRIAIFRIDIFRITIFRITIFRITIFRIATFKIVIFRIATFRIAIFRIAIFRITIFRITIFKILTQIFLRYNVISLSNYSFIIILHHLHYQNLSQSTSLSSLPKYRSFNIFFTSKHPCNLPQLFDKKGNGEIQVQDLKHSLMTLGDHLAEEELDELIREIDIEGIGMINYEGQ